MNLTVVARELPDALVSHLTDLVGRAPSLREQDRARWAHAPDGPPMREAVAQACAANASDFAYLPADMRLESFALLAMDMDSTLISIECIDEVADFAGRKAEVSAITEAAMRGEITDYKESLRRRVALLEGLPQEALARVLEERLRLNPGAERLVSTARAAGLRTLLVSGGFTFFTDSMRERLSLDEVRSNELEIRGGKLTGALLGDIVDAQVKAQTLAASCERLGVPPSRAIAMGDGANDLAMMRLAGLSVAYHAKPVVRSQTTASIDVGGLDVLLRWLAP